VRWLGVPMPFIGSEVRERRQSGRRSVGSSFGGR
jgi:hypothetical protein